MIIAAIRHLPTKLNSQGLLQGRLDISIDSKAIDQNQINFNKKLIDTLMPEVIFVSPLKRTIETCNLYSYKNYKIDSRIIEFDFGKYEGKLKSKMLEDNGQSWLDNFPEIEFGETFQPFQKRLDNFIDEVNSKYDTVLIFSHGVVLRYIMAKVYMANYNQTNRLLIKNNQLVILPFGQ